MSFYDKYVNSRFYHFVDIFLKFIVLNVMMLVTTILGLGVFGLPVALLAGILTSKIILQKGSNGIVKIYISVVKNVFKKSIKSIIMFSLLLVVLGFNLMFFYAGLEPFSWYYLFSFMIMLILFAVSLIAYVHALLLSSVYDISLKSLVKHSYLLTMGFTVRGILWLIISFILIYIMILIPILGLIIGLSSFGMMTFLIIVTGYVKIEALDDILEEFIEKIVY